jgi:O-antigen/teichoic acid export membrane protein
MNRRWADASVGADSLVALAGRLFGVAAALGLSFGLYQLLGPATYGSWTLLASLLAGASVVDLGLPGAVERAFAASRAGDDPGTAGATLAAATVVVVVAAFIGQAGLMAYVVRTPAVSTELWTAALLLPGSLALAVFSQVLAGALTGVRAFVSSYTWRAAGIGTGTAATLWLAATGVRRLDVLLLAYASGFALTALGCAASLIRQWPEFRFLARPRRSTLNAVLELGSAMQAAALAPFVADYLFRLFAASRFGLAAAATYDLAARIAIVPRSLVSALLSAIVPRAAQLAEGADFDGVRALHARATHAALLLVLPATGVMMLLADAATHFVASADAATGPLLTTVMLLLVGHGVATVFVPGLFVGRAVGRPWPEAIGAGAAALTGLALLAVSPSMPTAAAALWLTHAVFLAVAAIWIGERLALASVLTNDARRLIAVSAAVFGTAVLVQHATPSTVWGPGPAALTVVIGGSVWAIAVRRMGLVPAFVETALQKWWRPATK